MELDLSHFCAAGDGAYLELQRLVDSCGGVGRSYELPCRLPPECIPERITLGFFHRMDGYFLYWRPMVTWADTDFFRGNGWLFDSFEALVAALRSLAPWVEEAGGWPKGYLAILSGLSSVVLGQEQAVAATAFRLAAHVGKRAPVRPLSLVFYGPTGVGKSELAKAVAPTLSRCVDRPYQFIFTELNAFTQPHTVHRLTGAPPGYIGYGDPPIFEAVRQAPHTVFLFDELEKAHPEVLKVFMSILDEGRCTAARPDDQGNRELDLRRCILLFTTNADLSAAGGRPVGFRPPPAPRQQKTAAAPEEVAGQLFSDSEEARRAMARHGVPREIAGRFGGFIGFHPLSEGAKLAITAKQIKALGREYGLEIVQVDPEAARALTPGRDAFSVRSSAAALEGILTPLFSTAALEEGQTFRLSLREDGLQLETLQSGRRFTMPASSSSL